MNTTANTEIKHLSAYVDCFAWAPTAPPEEIAEFVAAWRNERAVLVRPGHSLVAFWDRPRQSTSDYEIVQVINALSPGYGSGFYAALFEIFPAEFERDD